MPIGVRKIDKSGTDRYDADPRFEIYDTVTGNMVDNAQGYGYTSVKKAYAAYYYKHKKKESSKQRNADRKARRWLRGNPDIADGIDSDIFDYFLHAGEAPSKEDYLKLAESAIADAKKAVKDGYEDIDSDTLGKYLAKEYRKKG
jgi:hypothetical protein